MSALDVKLFRDVQRLWAQVLAIALVIGGGVATLVLAVGSHRSLEDTRIAYYERYAFADVFAVVKRAPKALVGQIAQIPGVAAVDARIARLALLDIPGFAEPATGQFVSLPDVGEPMLNRLYVRAGRLPEPGRAEEVVVNESFAQAHGFAPGGRFSAILNGKKRELVIVGTALSPEFIYTVGPGDLMPDDRRYAIVWMSEKALASVYDLDGSFSSVSVKLQRSASEREVISRLDALLDGYGGQAAYGRKDQTSHAWLDHELDMLNNMSRTLPPIFLLVSAFLVNLTLSRLVALEREQIGLMKALGYRDGAVVLHYLKFVALIVLTGIAIGSIVGTWLGLRVTALFGDFFHFPFLVFARAPDLYVVAGVLSAAAAFVGAIRALRDVVRLPPAVAMQPPAPASFHRLVPASVSLEGIVSQPALMMLRNISRHPIRSAFTALGMSLATAILVVSLFLRDTMEQLIDVTYFLADRQDATVSFIEKRNENVVTQMARLPGVLATEPFREVPVRIRHGNIERRIMISGRPPDADLRRIIDVDLRPVVLPSTGLAISGWLGKILGVQAGDWVEVDLLEGARRTVTLPVLALVEDYFGIRGMMDLDALTRLMRDPPVVSSVNLSLDDNKREGFYAAVKAMPTVSGVALQRTSLANFRDAVALIITTMASIYTGLAAVIAFGVVYNNARIALSERARELASLRVLGFTQGEVLRILLLELAILTLIAQAPGWVIGYGLGWIMKTNLAGEIMRVRGVIEHSTYVAASAIVILAAVASAFIIRDRVNKLDLVAVLKTRD
ncbi:MULTISPECIES: ABC transporter permease [Bradyrhizobium]|jgi:putative ABC transport system permease protein|uniref:Putative ABC transport system permease protein n=1 Tax=Bradyrhizobium elkanii TaxID=29448 RepID=A0A8I1YFC8_BRAEL|nr:MULTISPECIES: FtsX-like permease family protein [Bradyrhizobium]MBP1297584.1 putative ABC transport system permease protein [Bradyrhizobium elkanii]MCP1931703.1 putative ABC transport system permease protein [Bradyrhizobium elkanii]MCS3480150.1 putative ABC transport system permease protein [Bradyrhizobium elkanii]MCS3577775.1 putative ABC transport system permease protein [Bradyrhizobium elkanii]MCS3720650.1 putative ABC transport system permease protein [Bradyrhizobium elkanii]